MFALMARGKHHEAAVVLLAGQASRLETNEEKAINLQHRKPMPPCWILKVQAQGSGQKFLVFLHKKRLSLWPTARVLKRSGKEDRQAIEKYEYLSMYKPVRAASVSNGSPVHQNNAVARSIRASSSLQCQNAIAAPSRSATLCK